MKLCLVLGLFLAVIIAVSAAPQQQSQAGAQQRSQAGAQRRSQAGGQQRRQQVGVRRRRPQGGAQGQGAGIRRKPKPTETEVVLDSAGNPLHLDPNLTLSKISKTDLDDFLGSKEAVNELVTCFANIRRCKARAGVSLVRDVRQLGRGARCKTCDEAEQKHTRNLVGSAIAGLQQKHPTEWRRLLPSIGFLL